MNKIITRIINLIIISNVVLFCSCSNSEFESRLLQDIAPPIKPCRN